jgi:hypothetical protein
MLWSNPLHLLGAKTCQLIQFHVLRGRDPDLKRLSAKHTKNPKKERKMKKSMLIIVLSCCVLFAAACQRGPSPEEIVLSQVDLVAKGNLDGLGAILSEDVAYTMSGFSPEPMQLVGRQAIREWQAEQIADNMKIEISVNEVDGNTVKAKTDFITDGLAALGLEQLTCDEVYVFEDGLLKEWSCSLTEESINAFMAAIQAMEEAAGPPKLMVTFDGEQCLVDGPDTAPAGIVFFGLDNQSGETARIGLGKLDAGLTAEEVIASYKPGSTDPPSGATIYNGTKGVMAGKTLDEYGIDMEPGVYTVVCAFVSSGAGYMGAGLTISE